MQREVIVSKILEELAAELPMMFRALPDVAVWRAMAESALRDEDVDVFAEKHAADITQRDIADTFCCDTYAVLRGIVNEW